LPTRQTVALVGDDKPIIRMARANKVDDGGFDVVQSRTVEDAFVFPTQ